MSWLWLGGALGVSGVLYGMLMAFMSHRARAWAAELRVFSDLHHNRDYKVPDSETATGTLLLVVCPASGGGKAMGLYDEIIRVVHHTRRYNLRVYVTQGVGDVDTIAGRLPLHEYDGLLLAMGDSSVYEMVQASLRNSPTGCWPHPPLLHLGGGSSNVISGEVHGWAPTSEVLRSFDLSNVRAGSVLRMRTPGNDDVFCIHGAFSGVGFAVIDTLEGLRHTSYAAFGSSAVIPHLLATMFRYGSEHGDEPYFSTLIFNTDVEADKVDMQFGASYWDTNIVRIDIQYTGFISYLRTTVAVFSGKIADQWREGTLPSNVAVRVADRHVLADESHEFVFASDGTTAVPARGRTVEIECVPDALPWICLRDQRW